MGFQLDFHGFLGVFVHVVVEACAQMGESFPHLCRQGVFGIFWDKNAGFASTGAETYATYAYHYSTITVTPTELRGAGMRGFGKQKSLRQQSGYWPYPRRCCIDDRGFDSRMSCSAQALGCPGDAALRAFHHTRMYSLFFFLEGFLAFRLILGWLYDTVYAGVSLKCTFCIAWNSTQPTRTSHFSGDGVAVKGKLWCSRLQGAPAQAKALGVYGELG